MGSGTWQNTYYFDGVETTSPDNAGSWLWANPDQIEEIDVIIAGAPAEYGNFQGMVVNISAKRVPIHFKAISIFIIVKTG